MDWYQEQFRRYFGDDETSYWLYVLSIALWSFPAFALLFVVDERWGGYFRELCNQVFQTREGLTMQVGEIAVRRDGGYVEMEFRDGTDEPFRYRIRREEAHELADVLVAVTGITTTEGLSL